MITAKEALDMTVRCDSQLNSILVAIETQIKMSAQHGRRNATVHLPQLEMKNKVKNYLREKGYNVEEDDSEVSPQTVKLAITW